MIGDEREANLRHGAVNAAKARANVVLLIVIYLVAFGDVIMLLTTQPTRS